MRKIYEATCRHFLLTIQQTVKLKKKKLQEPCNMILLLENVCYLTSLRVLKYSEKSIRARSTLFCEQNKCNIFIVSRFQRLGWFSYMSFSKNTSVCFIICFDDFLVILQTKLLKNMAKQKRMNHILTISFSLILQSPSFFFQCMFIWLSIAWFPV